MEDPNIGFVRTTNQEETCDTSSPLSPNKSLQRSGTHKLLGRGRPSAERTRALCARVLRGRRAAAELGR
jgi:hypothetical protein